MDSLTMHDYITKDIKDLVKHPDFSHHAFRVATALVNLKTVELESIDVSQFPTIRTKEYNHA